MSRDEAVAIALRLTASWRSGRRRSSSASAASAAGLPFTRRAFVAWWLCESRCGVVSLESTKATDADVAHLAGLAKLAHLDLGYNPEVTDAGLKHLAGLRRLGGLQPAVTCG